MKPLARGEREAVLVLLAARQARAAREAHETLTQIFTCAEVRALEEANADELGALIKILLDAMVEGVLASPGGGVDGWAAENGVVLDKVMREDLIAAVVATRAARANRPH